MEIKDFGNLTGVLLYLYLFINTIQYNTIFIIYYIVFVLYFIGLLYLYV